MCKKRKEQKRAVFCEVLKDKGKVCTFHDNTVSLLFGNCSEGLDGSSLVSGSDGGLPAGYADRDQNADNRDKDRCGYYYSDEKISFH